MNYVQFNRHAKLILSAKELEFTSYTDEDTPTPKKPIDNAYDLSGLRFTFHIKNAQYGVPDNATFSIYNTGEELNAFLSDFTQLTLQVGYGETPDSTSFGIIFNGLIKQFKFRRENTVDRVLDILAVDNDEMFGYAFTRETLVSATWLDQVQAVAESAGLVIDNMRQIQDLIDQGLISNKPSARAVTLHGRPSDLINNLCFNENCLWNTTGNKLIIIPNNGVLDGQAIRLSRTTGLIDMPQQTTDGITIKALINPNFKINTAIELDNSSIVDYTFSPDYGFVDLSQWKDKDGLYRIMSVDHQGDTRGNDWYSTLVCAGISDSAAPGSKVMDRGWVMGG